MRAIILAAGLGTRLRPLTNHLAKPAVPFLNRPLVRHAVEFLERAEIEAAVVNLHYLPDTVREAVGRPRMDIHFSYEPQILGTAGALRKAEGFLRGSDDDFVVINGKIYFEQDLTEAIRFHRERKNLVTLVLVSCPADESFNPVRLDRNDNVLGFGPPGDDASFSRACVFTGIHILSTEVLDSVPEGFSDTVRDVYPRLISQGRAVRGFVSDAYWSEASTPSRYLESSFEVLRRRGLVRLSDSSAVPDSGSFVLGRSVEVGARTRLDRVIAWDFVKIGADCVLRDVIIATRSEIPPGTQLERAVVTADGISPLDK